MTSAVKLPTLAEKLMSVRAGFGPIEKTGKPKTGPQFNFVEAKEIAAKFVGAIGEFGLVMLPIKCDVVDQRPTASGNQILITVHTTWRIQDAVTGEFIDVESIGQGADNSDKAAPKAQTNAMKYAILMVLQAAGDDPETDSGANDEISRADKAQAATAARRAAAAPVVSTPPAADAEAPTAPPREAPLATDALKRKIRATAREKGLGDLNLKALAFSVAGKESSKDWTMADADQILATLDVAATVAAFAALELKAQ